MKKEQRREVTHSANTKTNRDRAELLAHTLTYTIHVRTQALASVRSHASLALCCVCIVFSLEANAVCCRAQLYTTIAAADCVLNPLAFRFCCCRCRLYVHSTELNFCLYFTLCSMVVVAFAFRASFKWPLTQQHASGTHTRASHAIPLLRRFVSLRVVSRVFKV